MNSQRETRFQEHRRPHVIQKFVRFTPILYIEYRGRPCKFLKLHGGRLCSRDCASDIITFH